MLTLNERSLLSSIVQHELNKITLLNEFVVPMGYSLQAWKDYKKEHKISNKDYHEEHPNKKWKVVHGNKRGEVGKALPGLSNISYNKANSAHRGIMMNKG